jgi:hypothetical protein
MPPSVERLITEALAIQAEEAQEAGAVWFMARAMVQATLPHRRVAGRVLRLHDEQRVDVGPRAGFQPTPP